MRRQPDRRFATAEEMLLELERLARQRKVQVSSVALAAYIRRLFMPEIVAARAGAPSDGHPTTAPLPPSTEPPPLAGPPPARSPGRRRLVAAGAAAALALVGAFVGTRAASRPAGATGSVVAAGLCALGPSAGVLFYRQDTGEARTARLDACGRLSPRDRFTTRAGWTHGTAATGGGVLLYDGPGRRGGTAVLGPDGLLQDGGLIGGEFSTFTSIAAAGRQHVMLYDASTGWAARTSVDRHGKYMYIGRNRGCRAGSRRSRARRAGPSSPTNVTAGGRSSGCSTRGACSPGATA